MRIDSWRIGLARAIRIVGVLLILAGVLPGSSVDSFVKAADTSRASGRPAPVAREPDSEPTADESGWKLAQQHLPELLPVLVYLRDHAPERYQRAIRELDRAVKRLEAQRRRGPAFYDVALRQWQVRGQIDLIKARLKVRPTTGDRQLLLTQMQSLREIELERLRLDREVIVQRETANAQRLTQATELAERLKGQRDELDRAIERLHSEPMDATTPAYLKSIGGQANSARAAKRESSEGLQITGKPE
jgi:hypothetical protein